ncbi:hypothetical protein PARPLA_01622 [Rhodobacteraceae bacterium THAF1]|uniref:UPF0262 family protein n=1 Tax=Palleronia sp. THAF1 TaxID=2587842 RepID=UPI000F3F6E1F|nr:UPF0262 family protein [Palleronia sp. THAF1]QFU07707.1 hypothetical protein FIU81_03355 [Palleronia sp. THAF1]VDC23163.1 hypothetical protein PARPLA_01622 [Rhodobacteraceae bacterium THAF1]
MSYLSDIEIDESGSFDPNGIMEQERRVAVFDLAERNQFDLLGTAPGPYRLRLAAEGTRIHFRWHAESGAQGDFTLALGDLAQTARDYRSLCESYVDAVRSLPPARIEEIDTARRDIHGEGARQLRARLADRVTLDDETARRLFTLIVAMTDAQ